MDRERGRGEDDDLEAIEAELDGQPTVEPDPTALEGEPPDGPPANGPPEHWLAYIRARAPGLLEPGGPLAAAVTARGPDRVPHGPAAARPIAGSTEEIVATAPPAGASSSGSELEAELRRAASSTDVARDPFGDAVAGPGPIVSAMASTPAVTDGTPLTTAATGAGRDRAAAGRSTDIEPGATDAAGAEPRPGTNDDRIGVISGHVDPIDGARDTSRPIAWPAGDPTGDQPARATAEAASAATIEAAPRPAAPPDDPWPALERGDAPERPSVDPFPRPVPLPPRLLWPTPPNDASAGRQATARSSDGWPDAWPVLPSPADQRAPAQARTGEWRVQAARSDGPVRADLPLPAWPTLPDEPGDDEPDWSLVERRLERASRLDQEQRRR